MRIENRAQLQKSPHSRNSMFCACLQNMHKQEHEEGKTIEKIHKTLKKHWKPQKKTEIKL